MNNEKNTNTFGATLNMRGKMRRAGVRTADYLKVNGKQNMIIIGATIFLFIIFTIINPSYAESSNLLTMVKSFVPYAILGLGVTFVIATGGIDLSIGTVMFASSVIAGAIVGSSTTMTSNLWLAIPIMILVGLLFGFLTFFALIFSPPRSFAKLPFHGIRDKFF